MRGTACFHGAQNVAIVKRRQVVRQAALDADFGGAQLPGLAAFCATCVEAEEVGVVLRAARG